MRGVGGRQAAALGGVAAFTALAGILRYTGAASVPAFVAATLALAGQAWVVSFATEAVGRRFGPATTGLLQSTLGNLPEFFVVLFALGAGQLTVAQTSIIGSVLANALLVLGLAIVLGARHARDGVMRFSSRLPNDTATLMFLASFIIVLVGVALRSHDPAGKHVRDISVIAAVCLLLVYLAWLIPYIRSERGAEPERGREREAPGAGLPLGLGVGLLAAGGVASAFVSDWFIHTLEPTIHQLGISAAFAGFVIVAIAGNAVENAAGLVLAHKGQADLSISVIKNSVAQVVAFLFPLLVLVSLAFEHRLTFALEPIYTAALIGTALAIYQVTTDGEATAFEGWALVASYVVLGAITLYE